MPNQTNAAYAEYPAADLRRYVAMRCQVPLFAKPRSDTVSIVDIAGQLRSVFIGSRLGEHAGFASDSVAYFDRYDAKADRVVRHFVDLERKGRSIGVNDLHIAGHARSHGLVLVTNNSREFNRVEGVRIMDWTDV